MRSTFWSHSQILYCLDSEKSRIPDPVLHQHVLTVLNPPIRLCLDTNPDLKRRRDMHVPVYKVRTRMPQSAFPSGGALGSSFLGGDAGLAALARCSRSSCRVLSATAALSFSH